MENENGPQRAARNAIRDRMHTNALFAGAVGPRFCGLMLGSFPTPHYTLALTVNGTKWEMMKVYHYAHLPERRYEGKPVTVMA